MSALSGCFFFLFPYCPDLFGNEGTKLKATDQGCTWTSQIDDATATTDLTDIVYWYFVLVPAKCTKFRKVSLIERFQQEGGVRFCGIALLGYFWCGVAVIFISKYGIAVFRVQAVCGKFKFYAAVVGEKIAVSRWSASFSWQEDTNPKRSP